MQSTQSNSYRDTPPTTQEDYASFSEDHANVSDDASTGEVNSNSSTTSAVSDALDTTTGGESYLTASAAVGTGTEEYPMDGSDDDMGFLEDVESVDSSSDASTQHMEERQQLEQQSMQDLEKDDHASASEQTPSEQGELKRTVNTADDDLRGSSISDENPKDSSVVKTGTDPLETDNATSEASRDDLGKAVDNSTTSPESAVSELAVSELIDTNHLTTPTDDNSQAARTDLEKILQGSSEAAVANGTASTNHENLDEIPEQQTKVMPDDGMNSLVSGAASIRSRHWVLTLPLQRMGRGLLMTCFLL